MSPGSRLFSFLGAALGGTLATASTTTSGVSNTSRRTVTPCVLTAQKASAVQWGPCDLSIINNTAVSCGFFNVPLNYNDTSVGTAKLALAKVNATLEPRLGTIFFNPGASALLLASQAPHTSYHRRAGRVPDEPSERYRQLRLLHELHRRALRFRRLGPAWRRSLYVSRPLLLTRPLFSYTPQIPRPGDIQCFDSFAEYEALFNGTVQLNGIEMTGNFTDPADLRALFSQADSLQTKYEESVRRCVEKNGDILKYLGTSATVRDIAAMTDAFDGSGAPINFYGISYGTVLGNVLVNSESAPRATSTVPF